MLVDILSQEDKDLIDAYRKCYAWSKDSYTRKADYASVESILYPWDYAKSQYLYRLFGNQLTISYPITYERDSDEILADMCDLSRYTRTFGRDRHCGAEFCHAFYDMVDNSNLSISVRGQLRSLLFDYTLADNDYTAGPVDLELPNGKIYKIRPGAKAIRVLGKIADAFNLPGFEEFRICHSLILNEKKLQGNLILSIHPLDYMTMSDNNSGWESCMSWSNYGGYRRGTVEMMNSPSVVVVYLSDDTFEIPHGSWNNKKWRCLLAVDDHMGITIKGYPYFNDSLAKEALAILRDLAEKNLGWKYDDYEKYEETDDDHYNISIGQKRLFIELDTGAMYSDLNTVPFHWVMINREAFAHELESPYSSYIDYVMPYSGIANCMCCGCEIEYDGNGTEDHLVCSNCEEVIYCSCCDEPIPADEVYWVDDEPYCQSCYDLHIINCAYCGEEHRKGDMVAIHVIPRLNEEEQKALRNELEDQCMNDPWMVSYYSYGFPLKTFGSDVETNYDVSNYAIYVCKDCFSAWADENLKEECTFHKRFLKKLVTAVYLDELVEEAVKEYFDSEENYLKALKEINKIALTKLEYKMPLDF